MPVTGTAQIKMRLPDYKVAAGEELNAILSWWALHMVDNQSGGFYGIVHNNNCPGSLAPKGVVLNSRILWTFSAAYQLTKNELHLQLATRAFEYLLHHFLDPDYGGVFWSVDDQGKPLESKKQIYAQAFCIYGMSEYYKATASKEALQCARNIFDCIERYSLDKEKGGYIEAFTREWKARDDLRLSMKDDNAKKTMNTHLHIIEAYANLFTVWPDSGLRKKIVDLLEIFESHIITKETHHLHLFMDENWNVQSSLVSFGHDIEAAWLLLECAAIVESAYWKEHYEQLSVKLADAAAEGLDKKGGLWYEYDPRKNIWNKEKHSWPQAEAMIGFFNAWQLTGDEKYLKYSQDCMEFIKKHLKDNLNGEWFWGITENGSVMEKEKAGFWKCPYHSSRACMEIMKRVSLVIKHA